MLSHFQQIASRAAPARPILIVLLLGGGMAAGLGLFAFEGLEGDAILMPGLILLLWAVTGLIFIDAFAYIPHPPEPTWHPWRRRLHWLWRGLHWALAVGFVLLGIAAVDVSLHIADVWVDGLVGSGAPISPRPAGSTPSG